MNMKWISICLLALSGCMLPAGWLNPAANIGFKGKVRVLGQTVDLSDNSNSDVQIDKLTFQKDGMSAEVEGFKREQNASDVREANALQMAELTRTREVEVQFAKTIGDAFAQGAGAVAGVIKTVAPDGIRGANEIGSKGADFNELGKWALIVGGALVGIRMWKKGA